MLWHSTVSLLWLLSLFATATSAELVVRNLPGRSSSDTVLEIRRRLDRAKRSDTNVVFNNSTSLNHGFDGQKLFQYRNDHIVQNATGKTVVSASIDITCTKCYIKGRASAKLTANSSFNTSQLVHQAVDGIGDTWDNMTTYAKNITKLISKNITHLDNLEIPPPNIDFNVKLDFPDYELMVEFENTELYVELATVLSSGLTYTLTLYKSHDLGLDIDDSLFFGVVFSIDLILSVDSEIEISNGFHVKLDDKVIMNIALFAKEASGLTFNGGKFEFLPVTVQTAHSVLKAVLRMQLRTGFSFKTFATGLHMTIGDLDLDNLSASAGIEARVYANVAEFTTNITASNNDGQKRDGCNVHVAQGYRLAIGAAAGASVGLLGHTWGPTPSTEIPIYYTSLSRACATSGKVATTSAASIAARAPAAGNQVRTTTTKVTYTAVGCASSGLINCPASLQTVTKTVATRTLTTTVPSGSAVVWSTSSASVFSTVGFKKDAISMTASSGKPSSYVPPPPSSSNDSGPGASATAGVLDGETGGVSNKVIIGVSVGVGVPVLLALIGGCLLCLRRRQTVSPAVSYTSTFETKAYQPVSTVERYNS
ncbi:hypothetical protein TOPH_02798 [Tolypocladium ophioglossoides CBS 100239]|uniref:Mid2 domain-containing protein n=1 Tax=Tolypocladium ophioglossoides (strain CBS 100239) TaxID=1163406 RepID=A0A0L0NES8_TOLOC|nr:hypothetical protein TOPH_02798 [Tolypocladium ophioglossoides CBS 100239]